MTTDPLVFIASIAPLQTAISIASDGGARVKVDIPESELEAIRTLLGMRGKRLIMTVQVADDDTDAPTRVIGWKDTKR